MEDVWLCRVCGHIGPADDTGRCQGCGLFSGQALVPRTEAEQFTRRLHVKRLRRRLLVLVVILAVVGGATAWVLRLMFDLGPNPPRASTTLSASTAPGTWSQYRRNPQNTGFTPDAAPFPHRIRWTYSTAKPLHASPAVLENHVYLTTEDGRAIALKRQTGQPVWEYETGWISSSTPVVAGDMVIIAIRPGRVIALHRHSGEQLWETDLKHPLLALASPILVQGTVYLGAEDRKVHALDAATGETLWTFATTGWIASSAAHTGERVIIPSQDTLMYVLGAASGRQRFVYPTGRGKHVGASAVIHGDRAYFGSSGGRVSAIAWRLITYPLESKLMLWRSRLFLWGVLKSAPEQRGRVWSTRVGGDVAHAVALAHDHLYAATLQGNVVALDPTAGDIRWTTDLSVEISAAPTVAGDTVMIGTEDGAVVALQAQTGEKLWDFQTQGRITGSPIVAGGDLYVVSHDGTLYALTSSEP